MQINIQIEKSTCKSQMWGCFARPIISITHRSTVITTDTPAYNQFQQAYFTRTHKHS